MQIQNGKISGCSQKWAKNAIKTVTFNKKLSLLVGPAVTSSLTVKLMVFFWENFALDFHSQKFGTYFSDYVFKERFLNGSTVF